MELFDYKDNCRLCLKTHTDFMKNIFTHCVEGYQDTLVKNVFALFKVELNRHEAYPQFICRKCLSELENILLFKEDLQRNQDFLFGLFTAAYPNYVEKKLHRLNYSGDSGSKLKSVAVNTDGGIDLTNLKDSEYIRVPVHFMKQFCPQVSLQRVEVGALANELTEIKEEIPQNGSLFNHINLSVNVCKYCSKVFRSRALLNTHCKEVHKLAEQQKTNAVSSRRRKRISTGSQAQLGKKIKSNEELIDSPQMDLENNNSLGIKAELCDPSNQQVDQALPTDQVFQENQALFLQNFDLIAKQEAAHIKTKQKTSTPLVKKHIFKKQMVLKKLKKTVIKPLKSKNIKNKMIVSVGPKKRGRPTKTVQEMNILCRSVQFLKRYGWRKLNSSSRRGTPINTNKNYLFQHAEEATKSVSKKGRPKSSTESSYKDKLQLDESKTAVKDEGCECTYNLDSSNQAVELSSLPNVKAKRSNSMESSDKRDSTFKETRIFEDRKTLKNSPTTSIASCKKEKTFSFKNVENQALELSFLPDVKAKRSNSMESSDKRDSTFKETRIFEDRKTFKTSPTTSIASSKKGKTFSFKNVENSINTTVGSIVTKETLSAPLRQVDDKSRKYNYISPRSFYNKTVVNRSTELVHDTQEIVDKRNDDRWPRLKRNPCHTDMNSVLTDDGEDKKELRIQLERNGSPKKINGLGGSPPYYKESEASNLDGVKSSDVNTVQKRRGRPRKLKNIGPSRISHISSKSNSVFPPKKRENPVKTQIIKDELLVGRPRKIKNIGPSRISHICSKSNSVFPPKKRGRPVKTQIIKDELLVGRSSNFPEQGKVKSKLNVTNNINTLDGNDREFKAISKKRGRPKKNNSAASTPSVTPTEIFTKKNLVLSGASPLLDVTRGKLGCTPSSNTLASKKEHLSTLQDLNDRYEQGDNIGLRIRLRKTAGSESLNSLKYDTQELDENFQIKADAIGKDAGIMHLNDVPDNEKQFASRDKTMNNNSMSSNSSKNEESTREKVVNLDLEDKEFEMLIVISDDDNVEFVGGEIGKYVESKNSSLSLEQNNLRSRSKSCPPLKDVNDDEDVKREKGNQSQTSLPLNKHKLKNLDSDLGKKNFAPSVGLEIIPVKRRGRPPIKCSTSIYAAKRSKSTTELQKQKFVDKNVVVAQEKSKPRSRSTSQSQKQNCGSTSKEFEMLIVISDDDDVEFVGESENSSLSLEQNNLRSRSKSCPPLKDVNDDQDVKRKKGSRSQTCLPLNKNKLKNLDSDLGKKNLAPSVGLEVIPVRRRGRPPIKCSPSIYAAKRSKSTTELQKKKFVNKNVVVAQKKSKPRSRSISQSQKQNCGSTSRLVKNDEQ